MNEKSTARLLTEVGTRISGDQNKKSFKLLYQGINKVDVEEFHVNCDNKGPTVTILYGKFSTLFGGYTSQHWSSNKRLSKKDDDAFLFYEKESEEDKCIFLPIKKAKAERAITCDANFGPTFGGGSLAWEHYDLQAFRNDRKSKSESTDGYLQLNGNLNVPCAYDIEPDSNEKDSSEQESGKKERSKKKKAKSSDINSGSMLVKRIEVYLVVDDELSEPWKEIPNEEKCSDMKATLEKKEPLPGLDIKQYNILLIGVIGGGKSSFYNTLSTVFSGKVKTHAPAENSPRSVTNIVKAYDISSKSGEKLKVQIYDIRGFEDERGYDHELEPLLDGKLQIGYEFPEKPLPLKEEQLKQATLNDEIHLVCFVTGISNFDTVSSKLRNRIGNVRKTVAKKGLPMVVVATKFDQICPKISEDVNHLYKSPKAQMAVNAISEFFGIPPKQIYPVVNYVNEDNTVEGKDRLALQALNGMVLLLEDYMQKHTGKNEKNDEWTEREKRLPSWDNSDEKEVAMTKLHEELSELEDQTLRVLVVGPVNSGKSSFIDSVSSALRDDIYFRAVGECTASAQPEGVSSTEKVYPLKYKDESGRLINSKVCFGDTPGFQETGEIAEEIVNLLGSVRNSTCKKTSEVVKDGKKIHCVCAVFDCVTVSKGMSEKHEKTMQGILRILRSEGIPFIVILTKCDEKSQSVGVNKRRVFEDRKVRECKNKLMETFGFKQKFIFPVVNYVDENTVDLQADALLIAAFKQVLVNGKWKLEETNEIGHNWQTEA